MAKKVATKAGTATTPTKKAKTTALAKITAEETQLTLADIRKMSRDEAYEELTPAEKKVHATIAKTVGVASVKTLGWLYDVAELAKKVKEQALTSTKTARGGDRQRTLSTTVDGNRLALMAVALGYSWDHLANIVRVAVAWPTREDFEREIIEPSGPNGEKHNVTSAQHLARLNGDSDEEVQLRRELADESLAYNWTSRELLDQISERRETVLGIPRKAQPRITSEQAEETAPANGHSTVTTDSIEPDGGVDASDGEDTFEDVDITSLPSLDKGTPPVTLDAVTKKLDKVHRAAIDIIENLGPLVNELLKTTARLRPDEISSFLPDVRETAGTLLLAADKCKKVSEAMTKAAKV
jgi:hypothetical protein